MTKFLKLLRVKHYIKNILILFPLIFSGQLFRRTHLIMSLLGFVVFSLSASFIYIINDMNDIANDRRHPAKCKRPLASGAVTMNQAKIVLLLLAAMVVFLNSIAAKGDIRIWLILATYIVSNLAYSFGAKNYALLDVFLLALGYILRIYYGALIIHTPISSWLYLTVLSMAFFLGMGKRRNELKMQGETSRRVLQYYNWEFLDKSMYMCLGLTIVFYSLWCESMSNLAQNSLFLFSIPLVLLICMRYSMDIESESDGDPIEVVMSDRILMALSGVYAISMSIILYGGKILHFL